MGSGDGGRLCCRLGARDDCFPKAAGARFRGLFVEVPDARSRLTSRWTADPESGGVVFRFLTGGGLESGEEPGETEEDGCGGRGLDAGLGCCGVGLRAIRVVTMTGLDVDATALETFEEEKKPRSEEEGRAAGDVSILWEEDEVNNAFKSFAHRSRFYGGCVLMYAIIATFTVVSFPNRFMQCLLLFYSLRKQQKFATLTHESHVAPLYRGFAGHSTVVADFDSEQEGTAQQSSHNSS